MCPHSDSDRPLGHDEENTERLEEYLELEKLRVREGLTPLEYQRWDDLRQSVSPPPGHEAASEAETRMHISYRTEDHLMDSVLPELPQGGLFVATPFAPNVGTDLTLLIQIGSSESVEIPCTVVTNNVADGLTTARLGMGIGFRELDEKQAVWAVRVGAKKPPAGS